MSLSKKHKVNSECLIFKESVSALKEYNMARHYKSKHNCKTMPVPSEVKSGSF